MDFLSYGHPACLRVSAQKTDISDKNINDLIADNLSSAVSLAEDVQQGSGTNTVVSRFEVRGGAGIGFNTFAIAVRGIIKGKHASFSASLTLPVANDTSVQDAMDSVLSAIVASANPFPTRQTPKNR